MHINLLIRYKKTRLISIKNDFLHLFLIDVLLFLFFQPDFEVIVDT